MTTLTVHDLTTGPCIHCGAVPWTDLKNQPHDPRNWPSAYQHRCAPMVEAELLKANAIIDVVKALVKDRDRMPLGQFINVVEKIAAAVGLPPSP